MTNMQICLTEEMLSENFKAALDAMKQVNQCLQGFVTKVDQIVNESNTDIKTQIDNIKKAATVNFSSSAPTTAVPKDKGQ